MTMTTEGFTSPLAEDPSDRVDGANPPEPPTLLLAPPSTRPWDRGDAVAATVSLLEEQPIENGELGTLCGRGLNAQRYL